MEENVIHISGAITINTDVSVKNMFVKNTKFGILLHIVAKIENI